LHHDNSENSFLDWEEAWDNVRKVLKLDTDMPAPPIPGQASAQSSTTQSQTLQSTAKRKTADEGSDVEMDDGRDEAKRTKTEGDQISLVAQTSPATDSTLLYAQTAASFIPFLETRDLVTPKMPSPEEMETVLLQLRKKALVEEYFGHEK